MESKNEIKKTTDFKKKYFIIPYAVIWVIIIALNAVILPLILMVWLDFIPLSESILLFRFAYYIFIISPIIKIGFEAYEIVRFGLFLKSDKKDKESANKVARGFIVTRIFRNYYLVVIITLVVISEIFEFIAKVPFASFPREYEFLMFYMWFAILLIIDIFLIAAGPHLIKFSIDYTDKIKKVKAIVWPIVWIIVLVIIFNIDFFIPFFAP
ncbi:MAG: hypothetical protein ACFFBT_06105 [Promethearchaeota archaeon]